MKYIAEVDVETKKEVCVTFEYYDAKGNHCLIRKLAHPLKEALENYIKMQKQQPCEEWIPVSERLPKKNEYIGNVCKYYLIQDEYGDMHVARLSNVGWIPMHSLKAIGNEIIAWMPLPEPYKIPEQTFGCAED